MRLRWAFETDVGIYDHTTNDNIERELFTNGPSMVTNDYDPFAAMGMRISDQPVNILDNLFERFVITRFYEKTGIKWDDFITMPWAEANAKLKNIEKINLAEASIINGDGKK